MKFLLKGVPVKVVNWDYFPEYRLKELISAISVPGFSLTDLGQKQADIYYLKITISFKILTKDNDVLFDSQTETTFKLQDEGVLPLTIDIYDMYLEAMKDYANEFYERVKDSILLQKYPNLRVHQYAGLSDWIDAEIRDWSGKNRR